jgi:hypothetical protein
MIFAGATASSTCTTVISLPWSAGRALMLPSIGSNWVRFAKNGTFVLAMSDPFMTARIPRRSVLQLSMLDQLAVPTKEIVLTCLLVTSIPQP